MFSSFLSNSLLVNPLNSFMFFIDLNSDGRVNGGKSISSEFVSSNLNGFSNFSICFGFNISTLFFCKLKFGKVSGERISSFAFLFRLFLSIPNDLLVSEGVSFFSNFNFSSKSANDLKGLTGLLVYSETPFVSVFNFSSKFENVFSLFLDKLCFIWSSLFSGFFSGSFMLSSLCIMCFL